MTQGREAPTAEPEVIGTLPADSVAELSPMSAVFLYVLDPALEGTSDERGAATLRASQHAHGTGFAVALDDGQALVLD